MVYDVFSFISCFSILAIFISGILWIKTIRYCKRNNIEYKKTKNNKFNEIEQVWNKKYVWYKITFFIFLIIFIICLVAIGSLISQDFKKY